LDDRLPETVRRGIALHRAIDSFTDAHPLHLESRNRIGKTRRRYAGIIIDVCYDHFLSRHWTDYSSESLAGFAERVYDVLREYRDDLPDRLRRIAPHMIADDWLGSYSELANVGRALDGIARRIKRRNTLAGALVEVEANYAALDEDFQRFFPDLEAQATRIQAALVSR
jgi:acyl carrier protein phosphodiesterase